ncbi:MAG: CYTH domain-containing protein [Candidatus Micrarchaeales archaeon]
MNNMAIEVELRSFITKEKYDELILFFKKNGKLLSEDYQETFYLDEQGDLRIQRNNFYSKLWTKKGKLHDEQREEMEIRFAKEDFENLEKIMSSLGHNVHIKWFRNRHTFEWNGVSAMVDYTKGYGYILELEIMSNESKKDKDLAKLIERFKQLKIDITPKEEFNMKYNEYKENWRSLIK